MFKLKLDDTRSSFVDRLMSHPDAIESCPDFFHRAELCHAQFDRLTASADNPFELQLVGGERVKLFHEGEPHEEGPIRFEMLAYTGVPVDISLFGPPMVFDLAGGNIKSQRIPVLRQHDADRIAGVTDKIKKTAKNIKVEGVIDDESESGEELKRLKKLKFPWQASVGLSVFRIEEVRAGDSVKVNGRKLAGPLSVARKWDLDEVSIVPFGADANTMTVVLKASGGRGNTTEPPETIQTGVKQEEIMMEVELKKVTGERDELQAKLEKFEKAEKVRLEEKRDGFLKTIKATVAEKGDPTDPLTKAALSKIEATFLEDEDTAELIGNLVIGLAKKVEEGDTVLLEAPKAVDEKKKQQGLAKAQGQMLASQGWEPTFNEDRTAVVSAKNYKGEVKTF